MTMRLSEVVPELAQIWTCPDPVPIDVFTETSHHTPSGMKAHLIANRFRPRQQAENLWLLEKTRCGKAWFFPLYGERKQNYAGQSFWARGYFVSTVGRDEATIREYIRDQEQDDKRLDQLNMWK